MSYAEAEKLRAERREARRKQVSARPLSTRARIMYGGRDLDQPIVIEETDKPDEGGEA